METPDPAPAEQPRDYPPPPMPQRNGRTYTIIGFVLAGLAVLFAPIILGPAAVILGVIGLQKGDPLGKWAAIAGVAGMLAGLALAAALLSDADDDALAL